MNGAPEGTTPRSRPATGRARAWWSGLEAYKRWPIALGTPLLVVVIALALVISLSTAQTTRPTRAAARPAREVGASAGDAVHLRSLPHKEGATDGAIPFKARPPRRGVHLVGGSGVPAVAIAAYEHAALVLYLRDPSCHLSWEDVAGIGRVESDNGLTYGSAARVTANGTLFPPIYGPLLDGQDGFPAIATPDDGRLEDTKVWTRAVGPMQFLPGTWLEYAQSGTGVGTPNPQNFYDAALTTATFLCTNGGTLATKGGLDAAVLAYNDSGAYLSLVVDWIDFYTRVGAAGLAAAGSGLLPVGTPPVGGSGGGTAPTRGPTLASPTALLAAAAAESEAKGSYTFTLAADTTAGAALASGSGAVDAANGSAELTLALPSVGTVQERVLGPTSYVALPATLAAAAGLVSSWALVTPTLLARLPAVVVEALTLGQDDAVWTVAQLEGATPSVAVVGHASVAGAAETEYSGAISPTLAAGKVPAARAGLDALAQLLAGSQFEATAWVDPSGLVTRASLTLALEQASGPALDTELQLGFGGYGATVDVTVPTTSPLGPPPTSTTTTTTEPSLPTTTTTTTTLPFEASAAERRGRA